MQLKHSFAIPLPLVEAWDTLLDIENITPCLPGATAVKTGESSYDVAMKVRLGPLDLQFKGRIDLVEIDKENARFTCKVKVQESRGQGSATGSTVVQLLQTPDGTRVDLDTELMISGRVAQMGRGFVGEVSNDLLSQFAANLEGQLSVRRAAASAPPALQGADEPKAASARASYPSDDPPRAPAPRQLNVWAMLWRVFRRRLANAWRGPR
jgi:carbon monoxide dehydrogenase subunit G